MGLQVRRVVKGLDFACRELALKTDLEPAAPGKIVTTGILLKAVHKPDDNEDKSLPGRRRGKSLVSKRTLTSTQIDKIAHPRWSPARGGTRDLRPPPIRNLPRSSR
jgi:hypothetical protein